MIDDGPWYQSTDGTMIPTRDEAREENQCAGATNQGEQKEVPAQRDLAIFSSKQTSQTFAERAIIAGGVSDIITLPQFHILSSFERVSLSLQLLWYRTKL